MRQHPETGHVTPGNPIPGKLSGERPGELPGEPLLTYRQAGRMLGVTERTIWALVDQGQLPAVRFGRSVRIDPADLRAFIQNSKAKGGER